MGNPLTDANRLSVQRPDLALQLVDPSEAESLSVGSDTKPQWRCSESHPHFTWFASVSSRVSGKGCPACSGRVPVLGWNDFGTLHPDLAIQLVDKSLAESLTYASNKTVEWRCSGSADRPHPDFVWKAKPSQRTVSNQGCPACAGKAVIAGWNDLATAHPELSSQLVDQSLAATVTVQSRKNLHWFCVGRSGASHPYFAWHARVAHRVNGSGCPACAGHAVIVGWNDLAAVRPDVADSLVESARGHVLTEQSNCIERWWCEGVLDNPHSRHIWRTAVANRTKRRGGCPVCTRRGFDRQASGFCYLVGGVLTSDGTAAVKYGIANTATLTARLRRHALSGLDSTLALLWFADGEDCWNFEKALKRAAKEAGAVAVADSGLDVDGKTEIHRLEEMPLPYWQHLSAEFTSRGARPQWRIASAA